MDCLQRRQDGSLDFTRNWVNYEEGFGDLSGEFWLSLSKVHRLTGGNADNHNGMKFSTKDNDNDNWSGGSDAVYYKGAWWYNYNAQSNLNGRYYRKGQSVGSDGGIMWLDWKGGSYSLKFTEMKLRRN